MSKYIDRILEIQDEKGVWNTVSFPENGQRSSVVYGYQYDANYDVALCGSLVEQARPIETERLATETNEYITKRKPSGLIYGITLQIMKMQVAVTTERVYSQLADSFHEARMTALMKAIISGEAVQSYVDQECTNPRSEYDCITQELMGMVQEVAKIEAIATYIGGVTAPDRVRVIFFQN